MTDERDDTGRRNALACFANLREIVERFRTAEDADADALDSDDADYDIDTIREDGDALFVGPPDYILTAAYSMTTGGPACELRISYHTGTKETTAAIWHQDWFTPWIELPLMKEEMDILDEFTERVLFGGEPRIMLDGIEAKMEEGR